MKVRRRPRRSLRFEQFEARRVMTSLPYGATELDLGEFLLGDVAVTPVFFESNGEFDASTEDWNELTITGVLDNIEEGLDWWDQALAALTPIHELNFTIDETFALDPFETRYEPISRRSNDYSLYVEEFLTAQGFNSGSLELDMRAFNHSQREKFDTDWSFTIIVAPSFNDLDGKFAAGGSFRQAFAFAGGLFIVSPSTRPASTFTHEMGHIFWARDEYVGGGSFYDRRGYYNTQNLNAYNNPEPDFEQQPSIMASSDLLDIAYLSYSSPESTLAMVGWQDSDQDGIFDVLDVPHQLTGTGYFDSDSNLYRFSGEASVQTLPNLNPAGLGNDITINRIREIEYRFDGGEWQIDSYPDAYEVAVELAIPVPSGVTQIEIRARDSKSTVVSNSFLGRLNRADATLEAGINGFAWLDENANGLRDLGEFGPELWTVEIVDASGQLLELKTEIEPDQLPDGQLASDFSNTFTLRTNGSDGDGRLAVFNDSLTSTGSKNFWGYSKTARSFQSNWTSSSRRLQVDFSSPTTVVRIDAIGSTNNTFGRLDAYNSSGELVGRYTTATLALGEVETMVIERGVADIAYVIAGGHANTSVKLDHLRFGPDTVTTTGELGSYSFPGLPEGNYNVRVRPGNGYAAIEPAGGQQSTFVAANTAVADVDFGFVPTASPWQNPSEAEDVNADGIVSPLDALLIVNDINQNDSRDLSGSQLPTPPYLDVSGDNFVSALDVLLVVNLLNSDNGNGEGEFSAPAMQSIVNEGGSCFLGETEASLAFVAPATRLVSSRLLSSQPDLAEPQNPQRSEAPIGYLLSNFSQDADEVEEELLDLLAASFPSESMK